MKYPELKELRDDAHRLRSLPNAYSAPWRASTQRRGVKNDRRDHIRSGCRDER